MISADNMARVAVALKPAHQNDRRIAAYTVRWSLNASVQIVGYDEGRSTKKDAFLADYGRIRNLRLFSVFQMLHLTKKTCPLEFTVILLVYCMRVQHAGVRATLFFVFGNLSTFNAGFELENLFANSPTKCSVQDYVVESPELANFRA